MVPDWLHALSIVSLALGFVCAGVIVVDEFRHPQHMWIMNVVWPVTALFGTALRLWGYFTYGRLAHARGADGGEGARRGAAEQDADAVSGDGRARRDALRQRLHARRHLRRMAGLCRAGDRRLASAGRPFSPRRCSRSGSSTSSSPSCSASCSSISPSRRCAGSRSAGHRGGDQGRYAVADRLAGRHVRLHGHRRTS